MKIGDIVYTWRGLRIEAVRVTKVNEDGDSGSGIVVAVFDETTEAWRPLQSKVPEDECRYFLFGLSATETAIDAARELLNDSLRAYKATQWIDEIDELPQYGGVETLSDDIVSYMSAMLKAGEAHRAEQAERVRLGTWKGTTNKGEEK